MLAPRVVAEVPSVRLHKDDERVHAAAVAEVPSVCLQKDDERVHAVSEFDEDLLRELAAHLDSSE